MISGRLSAVETVPLETPVGVCPFPHGMTSTNIPASNVESVVMASAEVEMSSILESVYEYEIEEQEQEQEIYVEEEIYQEGEIYPEVIYQEEDVEEMQETSTLVQLMGRISGESVSETEGESEGEEAEIDYMALADEVERWLAMEEEDRSR